MTRYFILFLLCASIFTCNDELDDDTFGVDTVELSVIDTVLLRTDTLSLNLNLNDFENPIFLHSSKNASLCEIVKSSNENTLVYSPKDDFVGIDSVKIMMEKSASTSSSLNELKVLLVIFKVVKNEFHKKLVGKWNFVAGGGGDFSPFIWYPAEGYYEHIEYRYDLQCIIIENDTIVTNSKYSIYDFPCNDIDLSCHVKLDTASLSYLHSFPGDNLDIANGHCWRSYERIK